jgi:aflatoxin B1 aldehyde reductase
MVKVIFGMMGSSVAKGSSKMATPAAVANVLSILKRHQIRELDTARVYNGGKSEELLGACNASADFAVSTKAPGFSPGSLSAAKIRANCNASLKALQQAKMDIFYFHGPDRQTPLEEQCKAANALYQEGKFERFGVSNLPAHEVQTVYDICKKEGYVLPTVYQGGFNPISRGAEEGLFPTLRKLGIAFYAFSPLGGGYFSKPVAELRAPPKGTRQRHEDTAAGESRTGVQ